MISCEFHCELTLITLCDTLITFNSAICHVRHLHLEYIWNLLCRTPL